MTVSVVLSVQSLQTVKVPRALLHCAGAIIHITYCQETFREIWNHQTSIYNNMYLSDEILWKTRSPHCLQSAIFVCLDMQLNVAVRHHAAGDNLLKCWGCWAGLLRSDTVTPGVAECTTAEVLKRAQLTTHLSDRFEERLMLLRIQQVFFH